MQKTAGVSGEKVSAGFWGAFDGSRLFIRSISSSDITTADIVRARGEFVKHFLIDRLKQVVSGLSPGDRVIVTDMTGWVAHSRVQID
jgi:hypothetical protein